MTDSEVIEALATKCGGHVALAERLKVTRQTLWDWKRRGILPHSRLAVAALATEIEIDLPTEFVETRVARRRGADSVGVCKIGLRESGGAA